MNTYVCPEDYLEYRVNKDGWIFENQETGERVVYPDPVYEDGDEFYWLDIMGECDLPWQEKEFPKWNLWVETDPAEMSTFAKNEEELKQKVDYILRNGNELVRDPIKYKQIGQKYTLSLDYKTVHEAYQKIVLEGYDKVDIPISIKPTVNMKNVEYKFTLDRAYDMYHSFENVKYLEVSNKADDWIPTEIFTEKTPWIPRERPLTSLIVHIRDLDKPVKYIASVVTSRTHPEVSFPKFKLYDGSIL